MAKTDSNLTLTTTPQTVALSTSTSFSVQNISSGDIGWSVASGADEGGRIATGDGIVVDYDIDVWALSETSNNKIHIVRD